MITTQQIAILVMGWVLLSCASQSNKGSTDSFDIPFTINPLSQVESRVTFRMSIDGDSLGFSRLEFYKAGESDWVLKETAKVRTPQLFEEVLITHIDPGTLRATKSNLDLKIDSLRMAAEATYLPDGIRVSSSRLEKDTLISLTGEGYPIDRLLSLFFYTRMLDMEQLASDTNQFRYNIFDVTSLGMKEVEMTVFKEKEESENWLMQFRGGMASQNLELTSGEPNRIRRITFEEQPWVYELIDSN